MLREMYALILICFFADPPVYGKETHNTGEMTTYSLQPKEEDTLKRLLKTIQQNIIQGQNSQQLNQNQVAQFNENLNKLEKDFVSLSKTGSDFMEKERLTNSLTLLNSNISAIRNPDTKNRTESYSATPASQARREWKRSDGFGYNLNSDMFKTSSYPPGSLQNPGANQKTDGRIHITAPAKRIRNIGNTTHIEKPKAQ